MAYSAQELQREGSIRPLLCPLDMCSGHQCVAKLVRMIEESGRTFMCPPTMSSLLFQAAIA